MTVLADPRAGYAIFLQARSLCVRLRGRLDPAMAHGIADAIRSEGGTAVRLRLECSSLQDVDPAAAAMLAAAVLGWSQRREDRSVDVLNLDPALQRAAAWHPLRALSNGDEILFFDPDRAAHWSDEAVPASRH